MHWNTEKVCQSLGPGVCLSTVRVSAETAIGQCERALLLLADLTHQLMED